MNAASFLDTNIIVYAFDKKDDRRKSIAQRLIQEGPSGEMVTSAQVLAEFASVMLHKVTPAATLTYVLTAIDALSSMRVLQPDASLVRRAIEARRDYGVHFYDGMIIAAAERMGCARILSEDLNHGQVYFGVTVENPFK